MSTASPTLAYISTLQYVSGQVTLCASLVIIISGIIGNLLSCLVFAQRSLRSKPCVIFFLGASILNLASIISGVTPRALQSFFAIPDQTEVVPWLCKLRLLALFTMRTISAWLIALAALDRHLISSPRAHRRRMSNVKNAYLSILVISLVSLLIWAEAGYCFEANMVGTPQKCYAKSDACRVFNDLAQSLITTVMPSTVMLVAGFLMISNVRKFQRVGPSSMGTGETTTRRNRKDERSLTLMLLAQVILLTIFTLPQAGQKLYLTSTFYQVKSSSQRALESLIFNIVLLLTYVPSCIPFYLYTITGTIFRQTLLKLCKKAIICLH